MSKQKHGKNWKNCGTCQYWNGSRSIDNFGHQAEYDTDDMGKCVVPKGPWRNGKRKANATCNEWIVWGAFK